MLQHVGADHDIEKARRIRIFLQKSVMHPDAKAISGVLSGIVRNFHAVKFRPTQLPCLMQEESKAASDVEYPAQDTKRLQGHEQPGPSCHGTRNKVAALYHVGRMFAAPSKCFLIQSWVATFTK